MQDKHGDLASLSASLTLLEGQDLARPFTLELLEDELDFLAPLDSQVVPAIDHLPSVPETLDDSKGAEQKRKRSNPRLELVYLRSTVSALETQLSELRQLRRDPETFSVDGVLLNSVREDVVSRQLQLRQDAEIENTKLRATLLEYIRVAKAFKRLLRKRNIVELVPTPFAFARKRTRLYQQQNPLDEEHVIDELSHSLMGMYSHVDVVLRDPRFENNGRKPVRDFGLGPDTSTGSSLEILESRLLPFNFKTTADALWDISRRQEKHSVYHRTTQSETAADNTLTKNVTGALSLPRVTAAFRAKSVESRFDEPDRVVVVRNSLKEPTMVEDKTMRGVVMRHRTWVVVERTSDDFTRLKTYHIGTPEVYDATQGHQNIISDLTNFLLLALDMQLDREQQELETQVLKASRANNGGTDQP